MSEEAGKNYEEKKSEDNGQLVLEGLDLLASFRAIKSEEARGAIIVMAAAVAEAERLAAERGLSRSING